MKMKRYGTVFVPLCAAAFFLRAFTVLDAVDPATGYYTGSSVLPTLLDVFLLLSTAFFATVCLFVRPEKKSWLPRWFRVSKSAAVCGVVAAAGILFSASFRLLRAVTGAESFFFAGAEFALAALSSLFLIFYITSPRRRITRGGWQIAAIAPSLYELLRAVELFRDTETVFSRSFGVYRIVFLCLLSATAMSAMKLSCGIFCRRSTVAFAFCSGIFAAVQVGDVLLSLIPGNPCAVPFDAVDVFGDLALAAFYVLIAFRLTKAKRRRRSGGNREETAAFGGTETA